MTKPNHQSYIFSLVIGIATAACIVFGAMFFTAYWHSNGAALEILLQIGLYVLILFLLFIASVVMTVHHTKNKAPQRAILLIWVPIGLGLAAFLILAGIDKYKKTAFEKKYSNIEETHIN